MGLLAWASVAFASSVVLPGVVSGDSSTPTFVSYLSTHNSTNNTGQVCWETQGLHERDCFHAEPLTAETYPLTQEMMERASSRYATTDLSLHRAFQKARKRGVLKVVVVGGSVTHGRECKSPAGLIDVECAWPNRLQQWCEERIEDFGVEVINAATPGYSIANLLHDELRNTFPVDLDVDLIIVDYGVNDAILEPFEFDLNNIKLAHEALVSHVRNDMIHMPALIYAETFISPALARNVPREGENMADVHAAVTSKYDIPMVSFRDAVWPDLEDPTLADLLWGPRMHPGWQAHQLLADVLVYFIQKSYARFLEEHGLLANPSPQEKALSLAVSKMGCMADERSFVLDSNALVGQLPPEQLVESVGWSFSKDIPGRPGGLIGFGNSPQTAIVSFDLPCAGERRVLDIGYLKSYNGMGAVKVVVRGSDTDLNYGSADKGSNDDVVVVFDAQWKSRASLMVNEIIPLPNGFDIIRVTFELLSADTEVPYASFLSGLVGNASDSVRIDRKFKVTRMQCC